MSETVLVTSRQGVVSLTSVLAGETGALMLNISRGEGSLTQIVVQPGSLCCHC